MYQTTVHVEGMMCGMCESHINDAVRKALPVKKVESSRSKKQTVILSEEPLEAQAVLDAINATGYEASDAVCAPYEKKKFLLFGR